MELSNPETWESIERQMLQAGRTRDGALLERTLRPLLATGHVEALRIISSLHWASYIGHVQLMHDLVALGLRPDEAEKYYGDYPLHFAAKGLQIEAVRYLLSVGGTVLLHAMNSKGHTPYLATIAEGSVARPRPLLKILEWLHLNGVSTETQDFKGETALFYATRRSSIILVQYLFCRGANAGHRDFRGNTILHVAANDADEECLLTLCRFGAIQLIHAESRDGTPSTLLLRKRRYLQWSTLWRWHIVYKHCGIVRLFRNDYATYYWFLSIVNFFLQWLSCGDLEPRAATTYKIQVILFSIAQFWWIVAFLSDPGFVQRNVAPQQSHRLAAKITDTLRIGPVEKAPPGSASYRLQEYELYQLRANHTMYKTTDNKKLQAALATLSEIQRSIAALAQPVSQERKATLNQTYVASVTSPQFDHRSDVCFTCRIVKPSRAHHCTDCGYCILREDHHCVWLDNCVAHNNQRSFWCFLVSLSAALLWGFYYWASWLYTSPLNLLNAPIKWIIFGVILIINLFGNLVWAGFTLYLLIRTTRSMITNVTFWEYLKQPQHVIQRFHGATHSWLWDFADVTLFSAIGNIFAFWISHNHCENKYPEPQNALCDKRDEHWDWPYAQLDNQLI